MKIPIVYIKDSFILSETNDNVKSLLLQEDFVLDDQQSQKTTSKILIDDLVLQQDSQNCNKTTTTIQDIIYVNQHDFYLYNPMLIIQDNINIQQINYQLSPILTVQCNQIIRFKQNWCNSDNIYNSDIIQYYVNSDILVNDVLYNSTNIHRYKFDTSDNFYFFVNDNIKLLQQDQKIKTITQINGQIYSLPTEQMFSQTIEIDNKSYSAVSNIDGLIFNNKIHLSSGNHRIKIKRKDTTKAFTIDICVLSPYRRQLNKIYMLDLFDLKNAKYYSNYEIDQNQVNVFDNQLQIS